MDTPPIAGIPAAAWQPVAAVWDKLDETARRLVVLLGDERFARVDPERAGRCYELALNKFLHAAGDALAHGTICAPNQQVPLRHAWVIDHERERVWEPTHDIWLEVELFSWLLDANERVRYSRREAHQLSQEHRHVGPWPGRDPDWDDDAFYGTHGHPLPPWSDELFDDED